MENSELIKILQILAKKESEKPNLDDNLIEEVIKIILSGYELKVAIGGDGQVMVSNPPKEVLLSIGRLGIEESERKSYLTEAMQRILRVLVEMVFGEKEPENEIEEKIFEALNVPDLRVKAKLKRVYTVPVVDVIEVHPAEISVDGRKLKYYLLKIEHLKSKKPTTANFILTKGDLIKLHNAIGEVLSDGDVTQEN